MIFHALLVGAAVLLALRLVGFGRKIPLRTLSRYLLPVCWASLVVLTVSGGVMFVMAAHRYVSDGYLLSKIGMVVEGTGILVLAQIFLPRLVAAWESPGGVPFPVQ